MLSEQRTRVCTLLCIVSPRETPALCSVVFLSFLQATMDWEAQEDGFIAKILAGDGSKDIAVGTPVLVFVEDEVKLVHTRQAQSLTTSPAQHKLPRAFCVHGLPSGCLWPCWAVHVSLLLNRAASGWLPFSGVCCPH